VCIETVCPEAELVGFTDALLVGVAEMVCAMPVRVFANEKLGKVRNMLDSFYKSWQVVADVESPVIETVAAWMNANMSVSSENEKCKRQRETVFLLFLIFWSVV
jgi:hypothetical protein